MKNESEWASYRAALALPDDVTNLNAGTCSPTARAVAEELAAWCFRIAQDPIGVLFREAPARIETARQAAAATLDADPEGLLLLNNASYGVNTVLKSLPLAPGDELLTTDQEYIQYLPLLRLLERERGARVVAVPLPLADAAPDATPGVVVDAFRERLTGRTRAIFFSHVTSVTGTCLPARQLVELAREYGAWSVVDGAHAPGLVPVSLRQLDADVYIANLHKWLMGAAGSAIMSVRSERRRVIAPLMTMAASAEGPALADAPQHGDPTCWQQSHEYQGTRNLAPLMVVESAMAFRARLESAGAAARMAALSARCRELLGAAGLVAVTPAHPEMATAMVAFRYPGAGRPVDAIKIWRRMRVEHGFELAFPVHGCGSPFLRVSNAWFNTEAELVRLAALIKTVEWRT